MYAKISWFLVAVLTVMVVQAQPTCPTSGASPLPTFQQGSSIGSATTCTVFNDTALFPSVYFWCIPATVTVGWFDSDGLVSFQTVYKCAIGGSLSQTVVGKLYGQPALGGSGHNSTFSAHALNYITAINATNDSGTPGQGLLSAIQFFETPNGGLSSNFGDTALTGVNIKSFFSDGIKSVALSYFRVCTDGGSISWVDYTWLECAPKFP